MMSMQLGKKQFQRGAIARELRVAVDGVEEPKRRIGRVVEAFLLRLPETYWG